MRALTFRKINTWAFIFSFICVVLFFISISSKETVDFLTTLFKIHPLNIVLFISIITFLCGLVGIAAITNKIQALKSIITIIITVCLSTFIAFILIFANLFKFT